jgi:hypothetical protein
VQWSADVHLPINPRVRIGKGNADSQRAQICGGNHRKGGLPPPFSIQQVREQGNLGEMEDEQR